MKKFIFSVLLVVFVILITHSCNEIIASPNFDIIKKDLIFNNPIDFSNAIINSKKSGSNQTTEDSSIVIIVKGDSVWLRTRFNDEYDLLQHLNVFSDAVIGENNPFNWEYTWLIPKKNYNRSLSTIYSGCVKIHQMGDDACPVKINDSAIGANHGFASMVVLTSNYHGKSIEDVGSCWEDSTAYKFYILRVVNDSTLWLLSKNYGSGTSWAFKTPRGTKMNHYSGATHTSDIIINHWKYGQMEPVIKDQRKSLFYYNLNGDSTEVTNNTFSVYYGTKIRIFEGYSIADPVSSLDSVISQVGNTIQPSLNQGHTIINIRNTFSFDKWGGCVIEGYSKNIPAINNFDYGFIQSASLFRDPRHFEFKNYYLANVNAIADTRFIKWDMQEIEDIVIGPFSNLDYTSEYWKNKSLPPYRMIQFLGNSKDSLSVGYQMSYDTGYGDADPNIRKDRVSSAWQLRNTLKTYPNIIDKATAINTELNVRSFRGYFNPKAYSDSATCVQFFKTGENKYKLFLDYHKSTKYDQVKLPEELWGLKIVESDKHDSLTMHSDIVSPSGLFVSVKGYGYGVFDLVASVPATFYVGTTNASDSPGYGLSEDAPFKSWQYAINKARKNPGSEILIDSGTYTSYFSSSYGALIQDAYNIIIKRNPNSSSMPILNCSGLDAAGDRYGIVIRNSHNITLKDVKIQNIKQYNAIYGTGGIYVYAQTYDCGGSQYPSTGLRFENLVIDSTGGTGLLLKGDCSNTVVLKCDSYNNYDPESTIPGGNADGFGYSYGTGSGVIFSGCRSWNNSDDGYDLWHTELPVKVENCWAFFNGKDKGDGDGFKLGPNYSGNATHKVQNCLAFNNRSNGFDSNGSTSVMEWYDNTSYNNNRLKKYFYNFREDSAAAENLIKNNISYGDFTKLDSLFNHGNNNSWNLPVKIDSTDFISLDPLSMDDARDSEGNLPATDFLKLRYDSDLIDKGVDVGKPYNGEAPDLGCCESGGIK